MTLESSLYDVIGGIGVVLVLHFLFVRYFPWLWYPEETIESKPDVRQDWATVCRSLSESLPRTSSGPTTNFAEAWDQLRTEAS